jgi:hypothetical protein
MKVVRVTYALKRDIKLQEANSLLPMQRTIVQPVEGFKDSIDISQAAVGSRITIEVLEMPEEEFNKLSKFIL